MSSDDLQTKVEIIEYQSAERLRFELLDRHGKMLRTVEARWEDLRDVGARDRLLARLFESEPPQREARP